MGGGGRRDGGRGGGRGGERKDRKNNRDVTLSALSSFQWSFHCLRRLNHTLCTIPDNQCPDDEQLKTTKHPVVLATQIPTWFQQELQYTAHGDINKPDASE